MILDCFEILPILGSKFQPIVFFFTPNDVLLNYFGLILTPSAVVAEMLQKSKFYHMFYIYVT